MEERLQKLLSAAGICSRRAAEGYITAGRVTVNGETAELGWKADEAEVLKWFETEGKMAPDAKRYSTDSLAKYAYSVFWQLAKFSLQNNVPVILDQI